MNGALAGLVILAVGDSHMADMVSPLHDALQQQGATVDIYGMCGAMADDWLTRTTVQCSAARHNSGGAIVNIRTTPSWLLTDLLAQEHPNLIIVELGDNMAGYGQLPALPRDFITEQVRDFLIPIKARQIPCVWIGPPWGNDTAPYHKTTTRTKELSQFLSQLVAPSCSYIDTTSFAQPGEWPTKDGEHLSPASYYKWSQDIAGAIVRLKGQMR
jgi:lysophospholipase L1-like esterase